MTGNELIVSIIGDMQGLHKVLGDVKNEIGNVGKSLQDTGKSISSAGASMTAGITAPILAAGAGVAVVAGQAISFEKQMSEVFTLLPGLSEKSMGQMTKDAKDFAKEMGVLPKEVVPALYQAISAGVPKENVFEFLEVAQKAAVGGVTDLTTTVDGLTSVVNAYGSDVISVGEASDIMFTAVKLGKTDFEQLSKSLYEVIPTAASLGVGFDEIAAALATMTAQGTPTSVATAQLRQMMVELSKDGSKTAETFENLAGKSFAQFIEEGGTLQEALVLLSDNLGQIDPDLEQLQKAMEELNDPTSKLSLQFEEIAGKTFQEFQKEGGNVEDALKLMGIETGDVTERMADYFGSVEAGNAVLALTGKGQEMFTKNLDEMGKSAGATEKAYKTMSETSSKSLDEIKASLSVLTIELGEAFLPVLKDTIVPLVKDTLIPALEATVPVVEKIAGGFNKLPGPVKLAVLAFIAFIAALGPVLVAIGAVISAVGTITAAFGAGGALAGAMTFVTSTLLPGLATALGVIISPMGLIVIALAALALAWSQNWFGIRDKAKVVWDWLKSQGNALWQQLEYTYHAIIMSGSTLRTQFSAAWDAIKNAFSTIAGMLVSAVTGLYNSLVGVYNSIIVAVNTLRTQFSNAWNAIVSAVATIKANIVTAINGLHAGLQAAYNSIIAAVNTLRAQLNAAWNQIVALYNSTKASLISIINSLHSGLNSVYNSIRTALATLYSSLQSIWNNIKSTASSFSSTLQSTMSSLYSKLQSVYNQIKSATDALLSAIRTIWNNIVSAAKNAGSQLVSAISGLPGQIKNLSSAFSNAGKAILDALYDSIVSGFNKAIKKAKELLAELRSYLPSSPAEQGPFSKLPDWSSAISKPLAKSVSEAATTAKSAGSSIIGSIASGVSSAAKTVYNAASSALKKVKSLLPHSPAEEGPFSELPDWDSVFLDPMMDSIKSISKLSAPLSNALSNVKSPIDGNMSTGLRNVSNISNSSTNYEGSTYTIGPNYVRNDTDVQMIISAVKSSIADDRRRKGIFS